MGLVVEVVGQGYIESAMRWESTARINAGGRWSFAMPATDPAAALIGALRTVRCWWRGQQVGMGIISSWRNSQGVIQVNGEDMARELATLTVTALLEDAGAPMTLHDAVDWLIGELPGGWSGSNEVDEGNTATVYLRAVNDSLLAVLGTICDVGGCWYVVDGQTLTVSDTLGAIVDGVTLLALEESVESADIVNRIYLHGAGSGDAALDLGAATDAAPTGYSVDTATSALEWDSSPYPLRERAVSMGWIGPLEASDDGVEAAANALLAAGVQWLQRYATPVVSYRATVAHPALILPLERVALNWRGRGLAVNGLFAVVEAAVRIEPSSLVTVGLTLEADARRLPTDAEVVAGAMQDANRLLLWPQVAMGTETLGSSGVIKDTATGHNATLGWPARMLQGREVTLEIGAVANNSMPLPGSIEWRLNGAGSWGTYSTPVDLTSTLLDADSRRPLASSNIVNVRGVAPTEVIKGVGENVNGAPVPAAGAPVKVYRRWGQYAAPITSTQMDLGDSAPGFYQYIPAGAIVESTGNQDGNTGFNGAGDNADWLEVEYGGETGYVLMYQYAPGVHIAKTLRGTTGSERVLSTAIFDATVTVGLTTRASMLEE